jgi:tRNA-specific 2-thiouridylase
VRVLVAMSGGVDSSVAAALLVEAGHSVVGATLKLWDGPSDRGCCTVADVDDARRVADQLGVVHHVFNYTDLFRSEVVDPYVEAHRRGRTPNPCVECNRQVKFGALLDRVGRLGFDALATGHHAQLVPKPEGVQLARSVDGAKDQSYVLAMLTREQLGRLVLPVGSVTKAEVRDYARRRGLRTAQKPDSQDVCFVSAAGGRRAFLGGRMPLHDGSLVDARTGQPVGTVDAVELVTVGQRRGLAAGDGRPERRYAVEVDVARRVVLVADTAHAAVDGLEVDRGAWWAGEGPADGRVLAQLSAHGAPRPATVVERSGPDQAGGFCAVLSFDEPQRPVAPGQLVALYDPDQPELVIGSATVARPLGRWAAEPLAAGVTAGTVGER